MQYHAHDTKNRRIQICLYLLEIYLCQESEVQEIPVLSCCQLHLSEDGRKNKRVRYPRHNPYQQGGIEEVKVTGTLRENGHVILEFMISGGGGIEKSQTCILDFLNSDGR